MITLYKLLPQRLHLTSNNGKWILLIMLIILIIRYGVTTKYHKTSISQLNLLDGCRYVYIDLGTNIGVQIRKLYEPHLYPNSPVLPLFKQIFENHSNEVCSVGFEANPLHNNYLKEFESYCLRRNWRVKIFISTAVSISERNLTFYTEPGNELNNQWGASLDIIKSSNVGKVTVQSIDIVRWFKTIVLNRKIPSESTQSRIMMKSDIEGHDSVVLANLILNGVYCSIDLIYGEHLTGEFRQATSVLQRYSNSCKTKLVNMDDESYYKQRFPFIIPKLYNRSSIG